MVLKFSGIDSISDAEPLIGGEVQIPAAERARLEEGAAYISDLVGCRVFVVAKAPASRSVDFSAPPPSRCARPADGKQAAGETIGYVSGVMSGTGAAPLLVVQEGKREYLIPFAEEYIQRLDISAKIIELDLPEGMLSLDAPLSKAEKEDQSNSDA